MFLILKECFDSQLKSEEFQSMHATQLKGARSNMAAAITMSGLQQYLCGSGKTRKVSERVRKTKNRRNVKSTISNGVKRIKF